MFYILEMNQEVMGYFKSICNYFQCHHLAEVESTKVNLDYRSWLIEP